MESRVQQSQIEKGLTWVTLDNNKKLVNEKPPRQFINHIGEGAQAIFLCTSAEVMYFEKSEI